MSAQWLTRLHGAHRHEQQLHLTALRGATCPGAASPSRTCGGVERFSTTQTNNWTETGFWFRFSGRTYVVWPAPTERSKLLIILLMPNSKLPLLQYNVPITKLRMTVCILCLLSSWNAMRSSSFSTRRNSCGAARHASRGTPQHPSLPPPPSRCR